MKRSSFPACLATISCTNLPGRAFDFLMKRWEQSSKCTSSRDHPQWLSGIILTGLLMAVGVSNGYGLEVPEAGLLVNVGNTQCELRYESNYSLDDINDVTRAVVVFHGGSSAVSGSAMDIFRSALAAATKANSAEDTLIIAPQRLNAAEAAALPNNVLFWNSGSIQGGQSANCSPGISFFAVVDVLVRTLAERNPNLQNIVIAGHSGGGQLVNRYAAGTRIVQEVEDAFGVHMRFVITNPRTYMYFDDKRVLPRTLDQFAIPDASRCPGYNDYRNGLDALNPYMSAVGPPAIEAQYQERDVVYFLGGDDTIPRAGEDCEDRLQGGNRLVRGIVYYNHIADHFGDQVLDRHSLSIVPGVGHDHGGMFTSECGLFYLFDFGACPASLVPTGAGDSTTNGPIGGTTWIVGGALSARDRNLGRATVNVELQLFFGPQAVEVDGSIVNLSTDEFLLSLENGTLEGIYRVNQKGRPKKLFPEISDEFAAKILGRAFGDAFAGPANLRKLKLRVKGKNGLRLFVKGKTTNKARFNYVGSSNLHVLGGSGAE